MTLGGCAAEESGGTQQGQRTADNSGNEEQESVQESKEDPTVDVSKEEQEDLQKEDETSKEQ